MARRKIAKRRKTVKRRTVKRPTRGKKTFLCSRCGSEFPTFRKLKFHSKRHIKTIKEIAMLESGQLPTESKIRKKFLGKNKVIIS